jgi:hypothetical protein
LYRAAANRPEPARGLARDGGIENKGISRGFPRRSGAHPYRPTGSTISTQTNTGDVLLLSGYGVVFSTLAQTRGPGILAADTPTADFAELPSIFGDSGGPVIEASTGKALGIVSGIGLTVPPSTLLGPTVEGTLKTLGSHGFSVQLVTAPYTPVLPL